MHNENCGFKAHHKEQSEKSTNSIELLQNKPCITVNDVHTNQGVEYNNPLGYWANSLKKTFE